MNQNDQKPDSFAGGGENSQFGNSSGFGNSTFGGQGNTAFNSQANSSFGAAGNSKFGNSEFGAGSFGGNSSVSQIFKEGAFGEDEKRKRFIVIGAAVVAISVIGGAVYLIFLQDSVSESDFSIPQTASEFDSAATDDRLLADDAFGEADVGAVDAGAEPALGLEPAPLDAAATDGGLAEGAGADFGAPARPAASSFGVTGNVTSWDYNEVSGGPVVNVAPGAMVEVSRSADFLSTYVYGPAVDAAFRIPNPPPGAVYWREQGSQTVNQITVNPPAQLGISFAAPASITPGESLSWSSDRAASYYRVEFSADPNFADIAAAYSTTGNSAAIDGLNPGAYYVRVGGLNVQAGRFEYSQASSVTMQ